MRSFLLVTLPIALGSCLLFTEPKPFTSDDEFPVDPNWPGFETCEVSTEH